MRQTETPDRALIDRMDFSGVAGVEPQSETVWRQANRNGVPRICFINKLDSLGADFTRVVEMIEDRLGAAALVVQLPIGVEAEFCGVIDLLSMTARTWKDGEQITGPVPEALEESARTARANLVEHLAEWDSDCMNSYLDDEGEGLSSGAMVDAHPVLLEPIMKVNVTTPEDYLGSVIGDLNSRRAIVAEPSAGTFEHEVTALAPLSEMFGYVGQLRSFSSGRASFSMAFDGYKIAPVSHVAEMVSA